MIDNTTNVSAYRLTIIAAIVVLILSVGLIVVIAPNQATQYITLVGTIAVPGLLALFKLEQNAKVSSIRHEENRVAINKLVDDNKVIGDAIKDIHSKDLPIEEAALMVSEVLSSDPERSTTEPAS